VVEISDVHGMVAVGTSQGRVDCFDPRSRKRIGSLDVAASIPQSLANGGLPEISAMKIAPNGLLMACGTSTGQVLTFDIRSCAPIFTKDHNYGLPIKSVIYHSAGDRLISADTKGLKIYDQNTGKNFVALDMAADINQLCVYRDSGLIFAANESPKMFSYFIPQLAPAPKWCAYLDTLSEELEEDAAPVVYDDFKFVTRTRAELDAVSLSPLIGTNVLRAHMHGFFMDVRLYAEAKAMVDPFAYDEYRKAKIEKLLDEGTAKRIKLKRAARALPKVNRHLAQRMLSDDPKKTEKAKKRARKLAEEKGQEPSDDEGDDAEDGASAAPDSSNPIGDNRFAAMFQDKDFEVDFESNEYKLLNPSSKGGPNGNGEDAFGEDPALHLMEDTSSESEVEGRKDDESEDEEEARERAKRQKRDEKRKKQKTKDAARAKPNFYEVKEGEDLNPGELTMSVQQQKNQVSDTKKQKSFRSRLKAQAKAAPSDVYSISHSGGGAKTMTYRTGGAKADAEEEAEPKAAQRRERRGVKSLGLKKDPKQKFWRGKPVSN